MHELRVWGKREEYEFELRNHLRMPYYFDFRNLPIHRAYHQGKQGPTIMPASLKRCPLLIKAGDGNGLEGDVA